MTSSVCEGLRLETWLGRWLSDDSSVVESRSDPLSKLGVPEETVREELPLVPLLPLLPLALLLLGYSVLASVSAPQLPTPARGTGGINSVRACAYGRISYIL